MNLKRAAAIIATTVLGATVGLVVGYFTSGYVGMSAGFYYWITYPIDSWHWPVLGALFCGFPLRRSRTMQRRHFTQTHPLEVRLANEAAKLRKEARGMPHGVERERLIRRARQAETGSHLSEWLRSPGLQPQK